MSLDTVPIVLKDGKHATIEHWDFDRLSAEAARDYPVYHDGFESIFSKFFYFGPDTAEQFHRECYAKPLYAQEKNLSPLERQETMGLPNAAYHHTLAATDESGLIGLLVCGWLKSWDRFWCYEVRFVDVHNDHKHGGIGSALLQALDSAPFLRGKAIQEGMYSGEGKLYMRHVWERTMRAKDYALIPSGYWPETLPAGPGKYDLDGKRLS